MARKSTPNDGAATTAPSSISATTVPAQAQDDAGQAVRTPETSVAPKPTPAVTIKAKDGKAVGVGDTVQCPAHGANVNDPLELVTGVITNIDGQRITLRPVEFLDRSPNGTITPRKSAHFTPSEQTIAASHCTRIG